MDGNKPFTSIEYRWPNTRVELKNNLVSHNILARDGALAAAEANVANAAPSLFRDGAAGDLVGSGNRRRGNQADRGMGAGARFGKDGSYLANGARPTLIKHSCGLEEAK